MYKSSDVIKKLDKPVLTYKDVPYNAALIFNAGVEKINGKFAFEILCDSMAADNFGAILDVYWLSYAGVNPAKFIREHSENIACIHLKDLRVVDNKPGYAEIGQGNIDWDDVISACQECGVEYALVEQDGNHMDNDPFKSLKISYDFLKKKGIV